MRIIAGEHRGRRLRSPPGEGTRPMLDRVRQAVFSTLGESCAGERVLDLFAGSGSLGLEALSRGAAFARLVERDPRTVKVLRANLESLELGDRAEVVRADALEGEAWRSERTERYDLVFFDPPYPMLDEPAKRRALLESLGRLVRARLAPRGTLVLHAPRGRLRAAELPQGTAAEVREYGTNAIWFLRSDLAAGARP